MVNVQYILFETQSGRILATGDCPEPWLDLQIWDASQSVMVGVANDLTDFICDGEVTPRPAIQSGGDVSIDPDSTSIVSGIVPGTKVFINNQEMGTVDDGTFEFSCPVPGVYQIEMKPPFPWIGTKYRVTVDAP